MTRPPAATAARRGDRPEPVDLVLLERPHGVERIPGDSIVSALAAAGERVFSRSFKYHRPRGLLTADYHDPGTILQVGDEPNVRAAHRRVEAGMRVSSQNTWPSLRYDVKAVNQLLGRFLPPGFYYKTFIRPERLWPAYEKVLARFAHAGKVSLDTPRDRYDKRYAHPDVLVAGGGPAGITAALAAARVGARVLLVEEEHELGGHLRWGGGSELAVLAELREAVAAHAGIEVLVNSAVLARYDENWIAVVQRGPAGRSRAPDQGQSRRRSSSRRASSNGLTCSPATTYRA